MLSSLDSMNLSETDFNRAKHGECFNYLMMMSGDSIDFVQAASHEGQMELAARLHKWFNSHKLDVVADMESGEPILRQIDYSIAGQREVARFVWLLGSSSTR